jgi:hypothetical protein
MAVPLWLALPVQIFKPSGRYRVAIGRTPINRPVVSAIGQTGHRTDIAE